MHSFLLFIFFLMGSGFLAGAEDLFDPLTSPLYHQTIKGITYQTSGMNSMAQIEFSDHSKWNFVVGPQEAPLLLKLQEDLPQGREITLSLTNKVPTFWIVVRKEGYIRYYRVSLSEDSKKTLPVIQRLEKVVTTADHWYSRKQFYHLLTLSDGSVWKIEGSCSMAALPYWKKGHSIVVTREEGRWSLLNIDAPFNEDKIDRRGLFPQETDIQLFTYIPLSANF